MLSVSQSSLLILVFAEMVVDLILYGVGKILLLNIMVWKIVGVKIMLTFNGSPFAVKMLILQMPWEIPSFAVLYIDKSLIYGIVG